VAFLYINSKGKRWSKHSYSAGSTFDQSPFKYYLQKVLGWREKDNKARFMFGKALEEAVQHHHEHEGKGALEDFQRRWGVHKETELSYTSKEKDWKTCLQMGSDMIRLYVALQPSLPIPMGGNSVWQREYAKEVFPGDVNYEGIEDAGKLDIVCYVDPNHPLLPKVDWKPEYGAFRPCIVDIKTSATDFPEQAGMAGYDTQLRRYSWLSGIRTVALLWFKKCGIGYKKGYSATVIGVGVVSFPLGAECVIAKVEGESAYIVYNDFMLEEMDRVQGKKGDKLDQTDAAKERAFNWLKQNSTLTPLTNLTRQRLQFNAGFVSEASANEAGQIAASQIVRIVNASKTGQWPNTFGIRYPKDDRNDAYFRAFVLKDEDFKRQNFTKSDEQTFDDLFREEDTDEA
jgi:hypothetical protein